MNGRAAKRARRAERHSDVACLLAWCATEDDLAEARRRTHDALIEMMGPARTGGVTWRWWKGERAREVVEVALADPDQPADLAAYYRQVLAHLREYGGYVVVASAPGVRV